MVHPAQNRSAPAVAPLPYDRAPMEPPPPARRSSLPALLAGVVVAALLLTGGAYWLWSARNDDVATAAVGDCLRLTPGGDGPPYEVVGCADPGAEYKVLEVVPPASAAKRCREVAGASRSVTGVENTLCVARKDVDPGQAVNVARRGDCLALDGDLARRLDCGDPKAEYKVLKRLSDVPDFQLSTACDKVKGSRRQYEWAWESETQASDAPKLMFDLVFCLGDV